MRFKALVVWAGLLMAQVWASEPTANVVKSGAGYDIFRQGDGSVRLSPEGGGNQLRSSSGGSINAKPADRDAAAWMAAVAPKQKIRIVPRPGGGWQVFSQGKVGSIVPSGGFWTIYFDGKVRNVMRSGSGWTVYQDNRR